jgi:hypothetical protein
MRPGYVTMVLVNAAVVAEVVMLLVVFVVVLVEYPRSIQGGRADVIASSHGGRFAGSSSTPDKRVEDKDLNERCLGSLVSFDERAG